MITQEDVDDFGGEWCVFFKEENSTRTESLSEAIEAAQNFGEGAHVVSRWGDVVYIA